MMILRRNGWLLASSFLYTGPTRVAYDWQPIWDLEKQHKQGNKIPEVDFWIGHQSCLIRFSYNKV